MLRYFGITPCTPNASVNTTEKLFRAPTRAPAPKPKIRKPITVLIVPFRMVEISAFCATRPPQKQLNLP